MDSAHFVAQQKTVYFIGTIHIGPDRNIKRILHFCVQKRSVLKKMFEFKIGVEIVGTKVRKILNQTS